MRRSVSEHLERTSFSSWKGMGAWANSARVFGVDRDRRGRAHLLDLTQLLEVDLLCRLMVDQQVAVVVEIEHRGNELHAVARGLAGMKVDIHLRHGWRSLLCCSTDRR